MHTVDTMTEVLSRKCIFNLI